MNESISKNERKEIVYTSPYVLEEITRTLNDFEKLKAKNTKLKQKNKAQKEKLDNIKYLCETTGLANYYLEPIVKAEIILQIIKGE